MQTPFVADQNLLTRLTPAMAKAFRAEGFWQDSTIYDHCSAAAATTPGKIAVRGATGGMSYETLVTLADRVAADLAAAGLHAGDRVAAWMSSRCEVAILLAACSRGGYVLCPSLHRNNTVEEITDLLVRMRAKALYFESGFGADAARHDMQAAAEKLPHLKRIVALDQPGDCDAETLTAALLPDGVRAAPGTERPSDADDIVYLAFTSGTTGQPKGVMHSNNTLLANARSIASDWGFDTASVTYSIGPLSHNLGFGALVLTLLVGGELVLHSIRRGESLCDRLTEVGANFLFGVPAHAMDLLAEIEARGGNGPALPPLRGFRISGAAVPSWVVERLAAHGIKGQSGYGMTEGCSHHYTLPQDPLERISGTSGRACAGYEVRIFAIDNPDRELATGEIGHIGGRGASLMMGYFDDQTATENAFNQSGWFMTGDLGRMDADGYLRITGRLKEIIIRGGHNIHPARIEQLAMRFPRVERAAALGIADERLGEKVCLVLMPKDGEDITADEILPHLDHAGLSRYDMPEYLLNVQEIPLSASGKMLKRSLLPEIASGALKPVPVRFRPAEAG
ncbi:acyl--CoA ligase [Salipiger sp. P9]|uniref:class I adenylate-forming enzyme family protein n=1 Tax=Salipiger pentaromativorans TaxID=2943193 RepID=UPI0021578C4B|nr:class I adenylate-forming enzyme family protein [Salipiger pentaromativorans]MCR8549225.1 acyl--CoA ligase [Salipiger pentaromativorans]